MRWSRTWIALVALVAACGGRTAPEFVPPAGAPLPVPHPEECNGLDDDLDGLVSVGVLDGAIRSDAGVRDGGCGDAGDAGCDLDLWVDEDFRDSDGRYIADAHCGTCGHACRVSDEPHATEVGCGLVAGSPVCVARRCEAGFTPSRGGHCVPVAERLCLFCADDGDCGDFDGAACVAVAGDQRCTIDCALGCPAGYGCTGGVCLPTGGSCSCDPGDHFSLACALHDPTGLACPGSARCDDGTLSMCAAPPDICDEVDNDCNGVVDDAFRDARGAYIVDIHNCGECGVDCTLSSIPEGDLVCGGDPFAPSCVLHCPDTDDGIQPGDRVDANRIIADGCECVVSSTSDDPGPVRTSGSMLDVNCDGADGIVVQSLYVATDGDDAGPGSPTRPMRTIDAAVRRAAGSLGTADPRAHVFVAVGVYTETLHILDGIQLHGGYRRDFLALDPDGFRTEVRAPAGTSAPGGAAIEIRGAGTTTTVVEWIAARGVDAASASAASFGAYLLDPGARLSLRDLEIRSGAPGSGAAGANGTSGADPSAAPATGDVPRAAIEDAGHSCLMGDPRNVVRGGAGGVSLCGGIDAGGGAGGSPHCPVSIGAFQPDGETGRSTAGVPGGSGGTGGQDSEGPITAARDPGACPDICCGLADFTVPTGFSGPQPGAAGRDGRDGAPGTACAEPFGRFMGDRWVGADATSGSAGTPGSGGGGGGAGGGTIMDWMAGACEFADGLGGGGGGGGAGGCGGSPGSGGTSGGPSVAILVRYSGPVPGAAPTIRGARLAPADGGRGGDGGGGGDGGRGANGALGGFLPRSDRTTPTLAGPFGGARGGLGGSGGAGGGGGGGCGGAAVGIWITGVSTEPPGAAAWRSTNTFVLGRGGLAGAGGGGAAAAPAGAAGGASDVLVR